MNYEHELFMLWKLLNYISIGRHCLHSFFSTIELIPSLKFNYFIVFRLMVFSRTALLIKILIL